MSSFSPDGPFSFSPDGPFPYISSKLARLQTLKYAGRKMVILENCTFLSDLKSFKIIFLPTNMISHGNVILTHVTIERLLHQYFYLMTRLLF